MKKSLYETTATNLLGTAARSAERTGPPVTAAASVTAAVKKSLYRTSEAKTVLSCGTTTLYDLINKEKLKAVRLGHRTYITAASLEAFVASLPSVVTPTMARAKHEKWAGHRRPRAKPQEDEPGIA